MSAQCTECKIIQARQNLLERKLDEVLRRTGMTDEEMTDLEMDEAINIGARTLDYTAIQETLRRRIAARKGRAA